MTDTQVHPDGGSRDAGPLMERTFRTIDEATEAMQAAGAVIDRLRQQNAELMGQLVHPRGALKHCVEGLRNIGKRLIKHGGRTA